MIKNKILLLQLFIYISLLYTASLQDIYNDSGSFNGYDKFIELDSNTIYTGGIGIYEGNVFLDCNGATIDLEEGQGIWIYADEEYPSSLHIEYCTITNGLYYGLSFGGISLGEIVNCNLINTNFGLKLFDESNVSITNSIFTNNLSMGIAIYTEIPALESSYLLFWNNEDDCMENCPG